jgi:hypothetical protein
MTFELFSAKILRSALISQRKFDMGVDEKNTVESCQFLKLLLNDEVQSLTLYGLPLDSKQQMQCITDTLFSVAKECPDLQKLVCEEDPYEEEKWKIHDMVRIFKCTLGFAGLQVLDTEKLGCNDTRLALLAELLPQLR